MYVTEWQPLTTRVNGSFAWRAASPPRTPKSKGDMVFHFDSRPPTIASSVPWKEWYQSKAAMEVWPDKYSDLLALVPRKRNGSPGIDRLLQSLQTTTPSHAHRGAWRLYTSCYMWPNSRERMEEYEASIVQAAAVAEAVNGDVRAPAAELVQRASHLLPDTVSDEQIRHAQSKLFWTPPDELMNAVKDTRLVPDSYRIAHFYSEEDWRTLLNEQR